MLNNVNDILGYKIHADDGEIGKIHDVFFDDEQWMARYLIVDTSLLGRRVLISTEAASFEGDSIEKSLRVRLTKEQIKNSPDIDTDAPVSRRKEREINTYYGWPYYWDASLTPGYTAPYPSQVVAVEDAEDETHLRSARKVKGYAIHGKDKNIGQVHDFIFNEQWKIRYLVVDTKKWLIGRKVLIRVPWIKNISWSDEEVTVDLTKEEIKNSPEFKGTFVLDKDYEERLSRHYGFKAESPEL